MFGWVGEFPQNDILSALAGYVSIACWFVVLIPQLWTNYKRKSSVSISVIFICLWLAGDLLNLVGSILQHLLLTMIILAVYYCIADIIFLYQVVHYRALPLEYTPLIAPSPAPPSRRPAFRTTILQVLSLVVLACTAGAVIFFYILNRIRPAEDGYGNGITGEKGGENLEFMWLPQVLGWGSAFLYLGSRIPQIILNFCNKSCEGLSLAMFCFSVLGNVTYVLSVLFHSSDPTYLLINLPWLVGSGGTLIFDFMIFFQFYIYDKSNQGLAK